MGSAKLAAAIAGPILWTLAGCHRLPNDRVYLDLAQTPPTVRAAVAMVYKPVAARPVVRYFRNGQAVYRVIVVDETGRWSWVELNPAGDQIRSGSVE